MKLIACHIENFGKLSDLSVEFSEGINVINESNAWGKSTLAAFLKAMFYGLDAKKDPKAFDKERNIYRPWQGGSFGGEVDFEVGGRAYRISRSFGRTEKSDEFHLYDLGTMLESRDYSEDIGLELFELDSASFKRSIYIAQNDCTSATSDSINAKLGNLAENTDDINNFETASSRMKAMLLQLTPDRVTGSIKRRKSLITQLEQDLRSFASAEEGLKGVKAKAAELQAHIEEMQGIRKNFAEELKLAAEDARRQELHIQYDGLVQEVAAKEEKKDSYLKDFPAGVPNQSEFDVQMQKLRLMEEAKAAVRSQSFTEAEQQEWNRLSGMFATKEPTDKEIDEAIRMLSEVDKQKEEIARQEAALSILEAELKEEAPVRQFGKGYLGFIGAGAGLLLVGIAAFVLHFLKIIPQIPPMALFMAGAMTLVLGVLFAIGGVVFGLRRKKEKEAWEAGIEAERFELEGRFLELAERVQTLREELRKVNETIGEFLGVFHVYAEVKDYQSKLYSLKNDCHAYKRFAARQEILLKENASGEALHTELMNFAARYGFSFEGDLIAILNGLQSKATEYKLAVGLYEESLAKKEAFEKRQEKSFWTRERRCPYTVEELNKMIGEADENIEKLKESRSAYQKQMEDLEKQLDLRDEKALELSEMKEAQARDQYKYGLLSLTHEYLKAAKEQLTARYMEPIARGFSKYYKMLTGDEKGNWQIDANIELKVREFGELRETKWLSAGYQDLIGVCMRLALVDAMYEEEKPFLILDDPFVNLDEEKVKSGNKLLLSVAEEYQVIYFTCHDSRNPINK